MYRLTPNVPSFTVFFSPGLSRGPGVVQTGWPVRLGGVVVGGTWDVLLVLRINGLFHPYMGVSRNRGVSPNMDGENNGNPY